MNNQIHVYTLEWNPATHSPIIYKVKNISTFSLKIAPFLVQSFSIHPSYPFLLAGLKGRGIVCLDIYSLGIIFVIDLQNYVTLYNVFTKETEVEVAGINFLSRNHLAV